MNLKKTGVIMGKNRFFVIGGSGFVGTRLIAELGSMNCVNFDLKMSHSFREVTRIGDIREPSSVVIDDTSECVVVLAAEHRDDVSPTSKYYLTNVEGTKNVLREMDKKGVKRLIFTSSVAVYGLNKDNPDEDHAIDPFNHYGKSKWAAEKEIEAWYEKDPNGKSVTIIRPTVIFGEKNRGNVYNLLSQIASGKFLMIGKGENKKSMAYVGNVVAFIKYRLEIAEEGYHVYNYIDKPDLTMNVLLSFIEKSLDKKIPSIRIPKWLGYAGGFGFDVLSFIFRKKLAVSSVRVRKFVATTQFDASKVHSSGFRAPYTLEEGLDRTLKYEFVQERSKNDEVFYTE
jgi:nucleoside-diphosphate-sugar epimerase